MSIQEWFKSGCNYDEGVKLYERFGRNKILLKKFKRNASQKNVMKLHYELNKLIQQPEAEVQPTQKSRIKKQPKPVVFRAPKIPTPTLPSPKPVKESEELKLMKSKPISFYPMELHSVYHQRINSFLQACTLKIKLNGLAEEETEKAFELQYQIFSLFELNDKCWTILRHYEETGRIMPLKSSVDYSGLDPMELVRAQQNLYSRASKRRKTIAKKELELSQTKESGRKARIEQKINEKKEELQQLENDIEEINRLMNK